MTPQEVPVLNLYEVIPAVLLVVATLLLGLRKLLLRRWRGEAAAQTLPPDGPPRVEITRGPVGVLLPLFAMALPLLCLLSACATTAIDKARIEFARTGKAASAVTARFKVQSRAFQEAGIKRIGPHTPAAVAWQGEFVVKRAPVEAQIRRCDEILSEASDLLLLSDDVRGVPAAKNATACISALKEMISKLFDGGS